MRRQTKHAALPELVLRGVLALGLAAAVTAVTPAAALAEEVDGPILVESNELVPEDQVELVDEPVVTEAEPAAPVDEPAAPADEPSAPADEPAAPADEPAAPADEPSAPADEPAAPADDPAEPVDEPTEPATDEPSAPADEPADDPAEPVDEPVDEPTSDPIVEEAPLAAVQEEAPQADPEPRKGHWVIDARSGRLERYWVWNDNGSVAKDTLITPENGAGYYAYATPTGVILRGKYDTGHGRIYIADNSGKLLGSDMTSNGFVVTALYDGHLERYWVDATAKAARSGFFTISGYGDVFGAGGDGYIVRGDFSFGGRLWSADNDGKLRSGWYVTSGFGHGTQRYWMGDTAYRSPHAAAVNRLITPSKDGSKYYAYARPEGYVVRGKWDNGCGYTYVAENNGRLLGSDMTSSGFVVTALYDGHLERYYVDAQRKAVRSGFFTVSGYGDVFGVGGQGYVFRGVRRYGSNAVLMADNDGKLPSKAGWVVTDKYTNSTTERYWMEPIYKTYLGAKIGYSTAGYAHYTLETGYVLRNGVIAVGNGKGYRADNNGKATEIKAGWVKSNGHWIFISPDPRAHFDFDINSHGTSLGHYDVLHDLWLYVNGYLSGSMSPFVSHTGYLICSSWDNCYVAVFKGQANSSRRDNWEPLFGWNCGNGSAAVINQDARDRAAENGETTKWTWDPSWNCFLAAGNDSVSAKEKLPENNYWAKALNSTTNYRVAVIPTNRMERWFTSVDLTLGYHSTITGNPANELGKHISHGCTRLDVNNAKWIYDNIKPGTRCIQTRTAEYK